MGEMKKGERIFITSILGIFVIIVIIISIIVDGKPPTEKYREYEIGGGMKIRKFKYENKNYSILIYDKNIIILNPGP